MRESDLVATMTVHYASDGEGAVVAGANTVSAAQDRVSASAQAMATATDSASRRQVSAAAAFDALSRRMDPAARAFADLERNQNAYNRALAANSSIVDKAGQGLDVYATKLKAAEAAAAGLLIQQENMRRQQSNLRTDPAAITGAVSGTPVSLNHITGSQLSNVNVREYAAQFEAAAAAMESAAQAKAMQIGQAFGTSLNESLIAGVGKSARDSASVFTAELDRLDEISRQKAIQVGKNFQESLDASLIAGVAKSARDSAGVFTAELDRLDEIASQKAVQVGKNFGASLDANLIAGAAKSAKDSASVFTAELDRIDEIGRQKALQVGKNFQDSLNQSFGIGSSGKSARDSAAVFEEAAAAQDAMTASTARLVAALNPLEAEQGRLAAELSVYKAALDAGRISQAIYSDEQAKAGQALAAYAEKLNSAATAAEHLRRQQSNLSTNTTVQGPTNPSQITGAQLSNVNVRDYAAQFEAAAAAQDAMAASTARLVAALNPFEAEQGRIAREMSGYKAALDAGRISQAVYTTEQEKAGQTLAAYAEKLNSAAMAAENLRRQNSNLSTNTTVAGPTNPTQILGTKLSNVNTSEYAAQFEAAAKAQDDMVAASNRLKAALNPLAVEEAKQVQELGLLKQALQSGLITAEQFAGAQQMSVTRLANLSQSLKAAGTAGRVMSGEMTNLGFQLNDVVTGLALGQSPFMILGQQGGQIIQIFANSKASIADFARSSASWVASLITPMTATIAGAVAATAAIAALAVQYDKLQVSSQRALIGAGQRTGTRVSDLNKFTEQNSGSLGTNKTTGLSEKEARALAEDFTKTGEIVISRLHGMSDAVVGFANQTGQSIDDARKAFVGFATDPQKGLEELAKTFGSFDVATRKAVDDLVLAGDKTGAFQVIIDSIGEKSKQAADNMGFFEKAARGIVNVLASESVKPSGLENQLETARQKLNSAIENVPTNLSPGDARLDAVSQEIATLSRNFELLQGAMEKVKAANISAEFAKLSTAADAADRAIIPQIAQLEELTKKIGELERAKAAGATSKYGADVDNAALQTAKNQEQALVQSQAEAARYNQQLALISRSWGNVGQSTALALQAAQNQLPVIEAIGGAAKMAAQATADYANAMDKGKTSTEAAALAASNLAAAQAQVNAAAKETLFSLQNQAAAAAAVTGQQQIAAQSTATYNELVHNGVDANKASAVAAEQAATAHAQATAAVKKQVDALSDANDMIKAQQNGTEATTAAAIAYKNAIASGADETSAAALSAQMLSNSTAQAASNAAKFGAAMVSANAGLTYAAGMMGSTVSWQQGQSMAEQDNAQFQTGGSEFAPSVMTQSGSFGGDGSAGVTYLHGQGRGLDLNGSYLKLAALQKLFDAADALNTPANIAQKFVAQGNYAGAISAVEKSSTGGTVEDKMSMVDSLTQVLNSQTADKGTQTANIQSELAWLQTLPQTIARDQKIASLTQSIDQLKTSTDGLNSTMGDLLSPYYTQDPRTSHIGFRSQGMASGGSFIVPGGYSSNDNMVGQIPLASGEEVVVRRPGEGGGAPINIYQTINIQGGANRDEVGRTQYHNGQNLARQLRANAA